jgi:hypothetical protein
MDVNRHFYLYAKGHYQVTHAMEDLLMIQSYRTGVDVKHLTIKDVYVTVVWLAYSHMNTRPQFTLFMQTLHDNVQKYNFIEASIRASMVILALAPIKEIPFALGFADIDVLPLSDSND